MNMMALPLSVVGRVFCTSGFARCLTTSALLSGRGIRGTVKVLGLREEEIEEMNPDELEAMTDASFNTFNQEAAHIEVDAKKYQHYLRRRTIQHKYFKAYGPVEENLLTCSMKEQLKYLHSSDPDQWTPEVLSKSFPISPEGVVRLTKSYWIPKSEVERQRHDKAVVARWKKHMRGQIGSFRILEKALRNKFAPEKLPSPVVGMENVVSILEGLHFDGEEPYVPKYVKKKNKPPRQSKMPGKSFYSIIEDYELKTSPGKEQNEKKDSTNNLARISGPPQYEGSYTRIRGKDTTRRRRASHSKKAKLMTFTEFMQKKK
ncbi:uncharacterized protein LOC123520752 [Portunus trituberculatus]|uniref:uncharacterized protein LOC123520752 n=1 Tax=Portunus trituberculatus TaxID=210409 RepID=UPI001E1CB7DB|nr:uncharacterized protein LOC123520752 [Portunus trituberculatus]